MDIPGIVSQFIHVFAGTLTLVTGPLAIFYNSKNPRRHRQAGKVFFYAMLGVCATSVAGYLKRPDQVFFQFLLGIAAIVLVNIVRGVRAIRLMQGATVRALDFGGLTLMGGAGLWMLGKSLGYAVAGTPMALAVLFGIFGFAAVLDTGATLRCFIYPQRMHRLDWYRMHVGSMLGAFTAATTAFTVNAASFLPWYFQWFGPVLLILPLQIYYGRKIKGEKARLVAKTA